ncbi:cytochrome d ubiquinol oxidase subunit II [Aerophototrophica crusticola]|uniref:Cytochrome d ubiquinol oxidase subunit II n=1 Tax=Aerophototrophica crusticola TaxID=1709002 RepID=A0A858R705_9PROT|nr:cytochrome d ubiquinol oxidase subunit II [Rhodospirillaceae bacterium B3]
MNIDLTLVFAGIAALAVFMYVLMDGFDLGVGILFPFAPGGEPDRDNMMNTVAPIWDGNETWLILGAAALFAGFPLAYSILLPALYLPVLLMLIALIFRGVAFEFRFKANTSRYLWNISFFVGSLFATFAQGIILGAFIQGFEVKGTDFSGSIWDWATPFSLMVGIAMVAGYALLGVTWLIWRTEGPLQAWCYKLAPGLLLAVMVFVGLVSLITPLWQEDVRNRWFSFPNLLYLSPVPVITLLLAALLYTSLRRGRELAPFILTMALFLMAYIGLAVSFWPYVVPPRISIWDAASPPESQVFLLVGLVFLIPTILAYTAFTYWVFRGKVKGGYAH